MEGKQLLRIDLTIELLPTEIDAGTQGPGIGQGRVRLDHGTAEKTIHGALIGDSDPRWLSTE